MPYRFQPFIRAVVKITEIGLRAPSDLFEYAQSQIKFEFMSGTAADLGQVFDKIDGFHIIKGYGLRG